MILRYFTIVVSHGRLFVSEEDNRLSHQPISVLYNVHRFGHGHRERGEGVIWVVEGIDLDVPA
jgi:hypothetical protein